MDNYWDCAFDREMKASAGSPESGKGSVRKGKGVKVGEALPHPPGPIGGARATGEQAREGAPDSPRTASQAH